MGGRFNHVGITVSDIERSAEFYKKFDFVPIEPKAVDVDTAWIKEMSGYPDAHILIHHLRLDDTILELLQYLSPRGENLAGIPPYNTGSAHVAIGVADIFATYERLTATGVAFRSSPITIPDHLDFGGTKAVYLEDPDGYTVELIEWQA